MNPTTRRRESIQTAPSREAELGSTTDNGAPAVSDRNSLTIGPDGPILLHDVHFLNQMAHFNRERVPERNVHAKGSGAFGVFETTEDVSAYTKAALFQRGATTEMLARFSTVAGEQGSPDTWRDPRGFALKFYTSEGNYDLVGNNTPVFFVRDTMKFPHFIRSQKRLGGSGLRDNHMQWDFWSLNPESAHQVTYLMGDRGIPKTFRHMNGYGSHTYLWVNAAGEKHWVKYHFHSDQGVESLTGTEAERIAGQDADHHRRDLYDAIEAGDFPSWTLSVQVMPYEDAKTYRFNPFDLTKVWPHSDYPLIKVGTMTLNRNPDNFFAQIEQAAFEPSALVPGIGFSPDKMLLGRAFAYSRHAPLPDRPELPAAAGQPPARRASTPTRRTARWPTTTTGTLRCMRRTARAVATPTWSVRSRTAGRPTARWCAQAYTLRPDDDDFGQAGTLVREVWTDEQRSAFVDTVAGHLLGGVKSPVLERAFEYWKNVDADTGKQIEEMVRAGVGEPNPGGDADEAKVVNDPIVETATNAAH